MKSVAKTSGIARQDIYRLVPQLHRMGLAEKIVATPSRYKATPPEDGINVLLRRKSQEYTQLQLKTQELINNFQNLAVKPPNADKFLMISEKKLLYKTLDEKNREVKHTLRVAGTWASTRGALFGEELPRFKSALKRGVKIRWITEDHEEKPSALGAIKELLANPLFEIRYFAPPIPLQAAIYDDKEVVMCIAMPPSSDVTSIASDNLMFVKVALNYWEEIWNASLKECSRSTASSDKTRMVTQ